LWFALRALYILYVYIIYITLQLTAAKINVRRNFFIPPPPGIGATIQVQVPVTLYRYIVITLKAKNTMYGRATVLYSLLVLELEHWNGDGKV
jgi:hypothetical protein